MRIGTSLSIKELPMERVSKSALKGSLGGLRHKLTHGEPKIKWEEKKIPKAKEIKLAVKSLEYESTLELQILIATHIDPKSDCFSFTVKHENKHMDIWKTGAKKISMDTLTAMIKTSHSVFILPEWTVKESKVRKAKQDVIRLVKEAAEAYLKKQYKRIRKKSRKIDAAKGNDYLDAAMICREYLPKRK